MSYLDGVDFGSDLIGVGNDDIHTVTDTMERQRDFQQNPPPRPTPVDAVRAAVGGGGPSWKDVVTPTSEGMLGSPVLVNPRKVVIDRDLFNWVVFLIIAVIVYLVMRNNQMERSQLTMMMNMMGVQSAGR